MTETEKVEVLLVIQKNVKSTKNVLSEKIEVIFVDLLLPKTKAISVGIV